MNPDQGDGRFALLTRHFLHGFFRLSFLDDAGEASFARALIGVVTGILVFGLAVARLYVVKYQALASAPTPERYLLMLPADELLMILLPMLIVGFVIALVSHSLFPDELDFRVLLSLPVRRRTVFLSKVAAVVLFASIFIISANLVIGLPFTLLSHRRWATAPLWRRLAGQMAGGIGLSLFILATIVAVQGLLILCTPQRWRQRTLIGWQTTLICEAVLALPFVVRLPRVYRTLAEGPSWLIGVAPAWFLGLLRTVAGEGDTFDARLAGLAAIGSIVVCIVAAGCYVALYLRFDRLSLQPPARRASASRRGRQLHVPWHRHPSYAAVRSFTAATLRRSGLHQLAVFGSFTAGLALALNGVLVNLGGGDRWLVRAAAMAPLLAAVVSTLGVRGAFLMPTNPRAAWIFRLTERSDCRLAQMKAVRATMMWRGVLMPMLAVIPLQMLFLGWNAALAALPISLAIGWLLVELITFEWRRIPFTCTVLFAKRPAAQTLLMVVVLYFVFAFIGTGVVQLALVNRLAWLAVLAVLCAIAALARQLRMETWGRYPLEFEDSLPDSLQTLRL